MEVKARREFERSLEAAVMEFGWMRLEDEPEWDLSSVQTWSGRPPTQAEKDRMAELVAKWDAEWEAAVAAEAEQGEKEEEDDYSLEAEQFRDFWNSLWFGFCGSFEDITKIPPMRFTDKMPGPDDSCNLRNALEIFSLKVSGIRGGLQWPLHVFGIVAFRDSVDRNRNIIFHRRRDNCQTLTQEVPFLELTGPSRAVVFLDPVFFEVDLKVKGATESEDKDLSFLAIPFKTSVPLHSRPLKRDFTSKLSTLEFALGLFVWSVEATISVRVTRGSWPDGFRARFAACTDSMGSAEVILLDSGYDKVPVAGDGVITLSRCVACVDNRRELKVSVKVWRGNNELFWETEKGFTAAESGNNHVTLDVGFCQMDVTVFWSLISSSGIID